MAAFFRGLLLFLFGAIVGAGAILFFTPSFNVVVSRNPGSLKPVEFAPAPVTAVAQSAPVPAPAPAAVTPVPAAPVVVAEAKPAAPAAPVAATAEPALDFKSISEHLILWPTTVTVKAATTVPVLVDGKKVQDLTLEAGAVLQLSKVLADGSLEARAKGAKFEIKSTLTDFSAELGKRVAELVAKGTKFDSPYPVAAVTPPPAPAPAAIPAPAPASVMPPVGLRWPQMTLAQRVDVLFGTKPEVPAAPATAPAPVTAPSPAAPMPAAPAATVPVAPAPVVESAPPAADPKAVEKGKDLDRKINQLFK